MSSDFHHIPILPAAPSLTSHLQALDLLAARLSSLSIRAEWETRVPLNAKASIKGTIVNTGTVKINVGGEWWVDMTPQEGEAWVRRRKAALLEEHAKVLEGWRPGSDTAEAEKYPADASSSKPPRFDPVFRSPVAFSGETPAPVPSVTPAQSMTESKERIRDVTDTPGPVNDKKPEQTTPRTVNAAAGPSKPRTPASPPQTIQDVLSSFMEKQEALAKAAGRTSMPNGDAGEAMINEEGLPIHEIREDEHGRLIGDGPIPVEDAGNGVGAGATISETVEEEEEDFWSDAAAARRAALRRKVFDNPSDLSSEDDNDDDHRAPLPPTPPEPSSSPRQTILPGPSINAIPPTPSSPIAPSPPAPVRRPSSSALPGKSILKPSAPRKKSVSFDSSVPEPPDSPGPSATRIGGSMFPTPVINIEDGIEEKKVPVLSAPKPSPKRSTFGDPFAGFKPGFLSGTGVNTKGKDKLTPPTPVVVSEEPESTDMSVQASQSIGEGSTGKKPSLFAQRQRAIDEGPGDSNPTPQPAVSGPSFPALSTSKGTSSVKNAVLEKPSPPPPPKATQAHTAGVSQTVTERPILTPTAGPSRAQANGHTAEKGTTEDDHDGQDEDEDDEEDGSDDDFYRDDEDEEEYDLDDAMLAREVALAYHQNRAYTELGRPRPLSHQDDDDDDDEQGEGGGGGVMLALPEISVLGEGGAQAGAPRIINPTPDSLRRFVRVGKLDNGKFVLAPGEAGWSDEDDDQGDGRGEDGKKENREEIRRALLGQGGVKEKKAVSQPAIEEDIGMPPVVGSANTSASAPTSVVGGVREKASAGPQVVDAPRKVSRFKADRMGHY